MKFKPGFIPIPIIAAIAALIVTASATIFGQIVQEGRPLETVGQAINLTAFPSCDGTAPKIDLGWTGLPGESNYLVFKVVDGGYHYLATASSTTYTDSSLTPGTTHAYQVTAGASGRESNQVTVTTLTTCGGTGQPTYPTPTYSTPTPGTPEYPSPTYATPTYGTPTPTADTISIILPQDQLPQGIVGQDYAGPSAWVVFVLSQKENRYLTQTETTISISGSLPPGITFNDALDAIDGIPTAAGTYAFTITATGPTGAFALKSASITVLGQGGVVLPSPSPTPAPSGPNTPPRAVTIVGPTTGTVGQTLTYSLRAVDPDGDRVNYRACWDQNGDGGFDQTECQETGQVRSGTEGIIHAVWPSAGDFLLYALAFDGKDYSQWTWQTVTITQAPTSTQPSPTPTPVGGVVPTPQPSPTPPVGSPTTAPGNFRLNSPDNGTTNFTNDPSFSWSSSAGATHYWIYLGEPGLGWYWTKKTPTNNAYWDSGNGWQTCPGCPAKDRPQTLPAGKWSWWVAAENTAGATWADIGQGPFTFTVGPAGGIPSPSPSPTPLPSPGPEATPGARLKPDLAIDLVTVLPPTPQPGEQVAVVATIINKGNASAKNFYTAIVNSYEAQRPCDQHPTSSFVSELAAGATTKATFKLAGVSEPFITLTWQVITDITCTVDELDETNNSQVVSYKTSERGPTVSAPGPTSSPGTGGPGPTPNRPPNTPAKPQGPTTGETSQSLVFTFVDSDPENQNITYYVEWGDGQSTLTLAKPSGQPIELSHSWSSPGNYQIKVINYDGELFSGPSNPLTVTISGNAASCTTVRLNGDPAKKLDVTFIPLNYSQDDLLQFPNEVNNAMNSILFYKPFSENKSALNVHRLDIASFNPNLEDANSNSVLFNLAYTCPTDQIIILTTDESLTPHAGFGVAILGRNYGRYSSRVPTVAHEFGHSFGHLADEYIYTPPREPIQALNCSNSASNPPWNGYPGTSIFQGCSDNNHFRATQNSIMRFIDINLPENNPDAFDPWNIKLLNDKLKAYE